jgi:tRNA (guanine-N7-)-methyltransferase
MARLRKSRRLFKAGVASGVVGGGVHLHQGCGSRAEYFTVQPNLLFTGQAPLEVEIGSGKGDFILERARELPERNFLAVELAGSVFQWLAIRVARSGLSNLRAIRADARPVVNLMLPEGSVEAFHVYFPDPWPKSRHSKHRLLTSSLIGGLARCLEPGGRIYLATDVDWYFGHAAALFAQRGFRLADPSAPGASMTNFGRRFASMDRTIHAGCFQLRV